MLDLLLESMININPFFYQPDESNADIVTIDSEILKLKNITFSIKREYLIHPYISGNKWRKLKYNIAYFKEKNFDGILTFGGAFSNHIFATAAAGKCYNFETIGIIRGENVLNETLDFAKNVCGMQLQFVSREDYRNLRNSKIDCCIENSKKYYILPEGGTNALAIQGCSEILNKNDFHKYSHICTCVGTGGTLAGIIQASENQSNIIGFSSLKGIDWKTDIGTLVENSTSKNYNNWSVNSDYTFGGYAKKNSILDTFILNFEKNHGIPLEFVYTGKLFYGIFDLIEKDYFPPQSHILAIHTGGLRPI